MRMKITINWLFPLFVAAAIILVALGLVSPWVILLIVLYDLEYKVTYSL